MRVESIDKEKQVFKTDDGVEYPLLDSDISESELNLILQDSERIVNEIKKRYG